MSAILTSDLRIMSVKPTEKGAKAYATKRGFKTVGRLISPTCIDSLYVKGRVWYGYSTTQYGVPITASGWSLISTNHKQIKPYRCGVKIAKHFNDRSLITD